METDIEIAQKIKLKPIEEIAKNIGIENELEKYGNYIAKVPISIMERLGHKRNGKLILVTAITPTSAGEGKSTITVGLGQAFTKLGKKAIICIREPSLGPVFGIKGGACGGGYSQVLPMEDINLHFTGDIHAIGAANNLISAVIDNHLYHGNKLNIDEKMVTWKRVIDMNDRALRKVMVGLSNEKQCKREDNFKITVASELMAILCLANNIIDLKNRINNIICCYDKNGNPIKVEELKVGGSVTALLKHAINPNLVQTIEHTPAFIHGGPFANIAHGCSSLIATKMALKLADVVITEAGFGADLGAEKFFDIKCRVGNLKPNAVVLVATVRALKMHGNGDLEKGLPNLEKQVENIQKFNIPLIVAINKFQTDTENELNTIIEFCKKKKIEFSISEMHEKGSSGGIDLGSKLLKILENDKNNLKFLYHLDIPVKKKIEIISKEIYGADDVIYSEEAEKSIELIKKLKVEDLPICMAKTQKSLSDNPDLLGRPTNFSVHVTRLAPSTGAGFIVVYLGNIMTMPGLPKNPSAEKIDIDGNGKISGLF